jgi:hypothetical protein
MDGAVGTSAGEGNADVIRANSGLTCPAPSEDEEHAPNAVVEKANMGPN